MTSHEWVRLPSDENAVVGLSAKFMFNFNITYQKARPFYNYKIMCKDIKQ